jgi:hypothetical protein
VLVDAAQLEHVLGKIGTELRAATDMSASPIHTAAYQTAREGRIHPSNGGSCAGRHKPSCAIKWFEYTYWIFGEQSAVEFSSVFGLSFRL